MPAFVGITNALVPAPGIGRLLKYVTMSPLWEPMVAALADTPGEPRRTKGERLGVY